jgi:hypothetical protein
MNSTHHLYLGDANERVLPTEFKSQRKSNQLTRNVSDTHRTREDSDLEAEDLQRRPLDYADLDS